MTNSDYVVVLVTASRQQEALHIARTLVDEKLAACVSLSAVQSIYRWQGGIQEEAEWQLAIKTRLQCFSQLAARIQELHSYTVPEIIALPIITGSQAYLEWLGAQLQPDWLIENSIEV